MQETLTFPTLGSPPRFTFPELHMMNDQHMNTCYSSELSSNTSTPYVSAPSSPSRMKGFYFSAPTSPTWAQRTLLLQQQQQEEQGSTSSFSSQPLHSTTTTEDSRRAQPSPQTGQYTTSPFSAKPLIHSREDNSTWAQNSPQTEHHSSSNWALQSPHTDPHNSSNWAHQSLQTELHSSSPLSHSSLQTEYDGSSIWAQQSLKTEYDRSSNWAQQSQTQQPQKTGYDRSSNRSQQLLHAEYRSSPSGYQKALQRTEDQRSPSPREHHSSSTWYQKAEHGRSPSSTEIHGRSTWYQKNSHTQHERRESSSSTEYHSGSHMKDSLSTCTQKLHPIITNLPKHKALKRLQVDELDTSYSRKSFYASAIPFSWEERPGTPKAQSVTSETSNGGEDDSASILLSGSSEFEFSARFAELEDLPMSPTPISSTYNSFKHQSPHGSPSPTYKLGHDSSHVQIQVGNGHEVWPLRPPPRLDNPVLPMKQLLRDEANEHRHSYGSLSSLSAPQSPRSPRIFDLRGVFCGISNPATNAVFDPFVAAMEKSMGDNGEMRKSVKKDTGRSSHGHHRRSQSLSPLRVFHWDDHSAKSNSSSNGSSCMDEVKNKHPIQREINARHSAGMPKGSKRWSFKGFLHRKSVSGSGGETTRHSNTMSTSSRSSGRESCDSPAMMSRGIEVAMDVSNGGDENMKVRCADMDENMKVRGADMGVNSPTTNNYSMLSSVPSSPSSILSSSSSGNSTSRGKHNAHKTNKAPLALHYNMQRAQTEELRKKTFLPYKQGLLGCLGLSSKSYRALATISKPLQSVS